MIQEFDKIGAFQIVGPQDPYRVFDVFTPGAGR